MWSWTCSAKSFFFFFFFGTDQFAAIWSCTYFTKRAHGWKIFISFPVSIFRTLFVVCVSFSFHVLVRSFVLIWPKGLIGLSEWRVTALRGNNFTRHLLTQHPSFGDPQWFAALTDRGNVIIIRLNIVWCISRVFNCTRCCTVIYAGGGGGRDSQPTFTFNLLNF